jgi:hypothetical protein
MVFSLEHDIKVTKNHQNLLPTQSVLVAHTVFLTGLEKFVKTVKSKCKTILKRFGSFRDVVSNNKILYATRFWVNWAFLIALEALKPSPRSCFNLVPRAIRKAQFTQKLVA